MLTFLAHVSGRPYHTACVPSGCKAGAAIGNNVTFTVVFFANPDPTEGQWQWSFTSINQSVAVGSNPDGVTLIVSKGYVLLVVDKVTIDLFGSYTVFSRNDHGQDQTVLQLLPEGKY